MAGSSTTRAPRDQTRSAADWMVDRAVGLAILTGRAMPAGGQAWLASVLAQAGFARQKASAQQQLEHIWPDLAPARRSAIAQGAVENILRGTLEIADSARLLRRAQAWQPHGDGFAAFEAARAEGRGVLLVTGHFGNWEAARAALTLRGHEIGGLLSPAQQRLSG